MEPRCRGFGRGRQVLMLLPVKAMVMVVVCDLTPDSRDMQSGPTGSCACPTVHPKTVASGAEPTARMDLDPGAVSGQWGRSDRSVPPACRRSSPTFVPLHTSGNMILTILYSTC